jgi:hypothetical protein
MPKPLQFPTKVLIGFDDEMIAGLDAWRRKQEDLPTRSEAIRRLVVYGLSNAPTAPASASKRPASTQEVPRKSSRPKRR